MSTTGTPGEEIQQFGRAVRRYRVGISAGALALAWARQEGAPQGSTVVVEREVSPLGRLSQLWKGAAESTLACAVVLRPPVAPEEADIVWLVAGLAAAEGAEAASGRPQATWWPDAVLDAGSGERTAATKAEAQLGPGQVRSAVVTMRIDMGRLGIDPARRDELLEAVVRSIDRHSEALAEGATTVAAAYEQRCALLGERVKLRLLPRGETRGTARHLDRMARLELESPTGMVERIGVDMLRELEVV